MKVLGFIYMREACINREQYSPNGERIIYRSRELLYGESTPYGTKGHTRRFGSVMQLMME